MAVGTSVRIYDLARDLKQDTKRVIEELRREGADVSVPSNSVSKELAEKVRNKYLPKTETYQKRAVKVIKKEATAKTAETSVAETVPTEAVAPEVKTERPIEARETDAPETAPKSSGYVKELKKRVVVVKPPTETIIEVEPEIEETPAEIEPIETLVEDTPPV